MIRTKPRHFGRFEFDEIAIEIKAFAIRSDADADRPVLAAAIVRIDLVVAVGVEVGTEKAERDSLSSTRSLPSAMSREHEQAFFAVHFTRMNIGLHIGDELAARLSPRRAC